MVGFAALAIALMLFSYYRSFYTGPPTPPPEAGLRMKAAMQKLIADTEARNRAGARMNRSAAANPGKSKAEKK
jgi:hypothetical protein